jgi:hypothetical protein
MLAGGRTVPRGRTDLALGGAIRIPVGDLVPQTVGDEALVYSAPGGVAPVALVRYGLLNSLDLGVEAAGTILRVHVRGQFYLGGDFHLMLGAAPFGGAVYAEQGAAFRGGALVPVALVIDITSVYEAWLGVRIGLEHVAGDVPIALSGLRTGGVLGVGVGFRRVHLLVELAVDHEYWWGRNGDMSVERNGIALTPAFALRLRL